MRLTLILSLFFAILLASCTDSILTDTASQPSYGLNDDDSYNMGILLVGNNTATQKLMLYNHNDGEIALESIHLRGGEGSIFRINVDGMAGTSFTNSDLLHIAKGDSLTILLEAAFYGEQQEPDLMREDYIDIQCNNRLTSIRLTVTTRAVELLDNHTITADTLWQSDGLNKLIYGQLVIAEGATLTIDPGVTLYLHDHASLEIYGTLVLNGTLADPISLIGDRTDKIFDNLYYVDMPSQWSGINIYPESKNNLFNYAEIRGMTYGINVTQDACNLDQSSDFMSDELQQLIVRNSLIQNSDSSLITAHHSSMIIENSCLMNSGGAMLELAGGSYDITHCTLANYNYWTSFNKADVVLRNYDMIDSLPVWQPLYRCNFTNTIIYGNSGYDPNVDVNGFIYFVDDQGLPVDSIFSYRFDHCLLHSTTGSDDQDCISILWTDDPLYQLIDMPNYTVDPHLQPESPCIGAADPRTLLRLPLDRDGKPRSSQPSIGCYE